MEARVFPLAKMDGLVRGLTWGTGVVLAAVLAMPVVLVVGLGVPAVVLAPFGVAMTLAVTVLGAVALYARPTRFEVTAEALRLVFPTRQLSVPRGAITSAEVIDRDTFRARYGRGMRIGAGGFLGAFGWLKTRGGMFHLYVSRLDAWVLLEVRDGNAWVVTPESPQEFVAALRGG